MFDALGTKLALKSAKRAAPNGTTITPYALPESLESAQHAFLKETILRNLLNKLEPSLGDRFHQAILHTPPGHEKSAYRVNTQAHTQAIERSA
jgi:Ethanolamine utilization protein EutJ (predicted chaperonin)